MFTPATDSGRTIEHGDFRAGVVASANLMGTSAAELVLGAGNVYPVGSDALQVVDTASGALRLRLPRAFGPFAALTVGDIDGDGTDEVVHALTQITAQDNALRSFCTLDASTGTRERCLPTLGSGNEVATIPPVLGRFNDSLGQDIATMLATSVAVYDGATLDLQWERHDFEGYGAEAATVARFNGDEIDDVVIVDNTGRIHILDGRDGTTLWTSVTLGTGDETTVIVANVDADSAPEILFANGDAVFAFDAQTRLLDWSLSSNEEIGRMLVWGAGESCRIGLYAADGLLQTFRCSDRATAGADRQLPANANFLRALDDAGQRFIVGSAGRVLTVESDDAVREWATGLGAQLGNNNAGAVIARAPRRYDLVIGSETQVYRVAINLDLVFADAFDLPASN